MWPSIRRYRKLLLYIGRCDSATHLYDNWWLPQPVFLTQDLNGQHPPILWPAVPNDAIFCSHIGQYWHPGGNYVRKEHQLTDPCTICSHWQGPWVQRARQPADCQFQTDHNDGPYWYWLNQGYYATLVEDYELKPCFLRHDSGWKLLLRLLHPFKPELGSS